MLALLSMESIVGTRYMSCAVRLCHIMRHNVMPHLPSFAGRWRVWLRRAFAITHIQSTNAFRRDFAGGMPHQFLPSLILNHPSGGRCIVAYPYLRLGVGPTHAV